MTAVTTNVGQPSDARDGKLAKVYSVVAYTSNRDIPKKVLISQVESSPD